MPRASSSEREESKTSRKKGRASVACLSCRARKLACDLGSPCSTCLSKNEGSTCSLANQLYYENMDDAPASKLKASVDRLEAMVLKRLSSQSQASVHRRNFSGSSRTSSNYGSPRASIYGSPSLSSNTSAPSSPNLVDRPNVVHEAEMISKLLLCDEVSNATGTGIDLSPIVAELRQSSSSFALPLPLLAEPHSLQNRPSTSEFTALLHMMPTESQTYRLADYFFLRVDPLFHLVHRPRFESQLKDIWTDGNGGLSCCNPFWLATFLIICGNGLVSMSDEECISAGDLPTADGKALLARSWMDASLKCLAYGDFINNPSMESIRATILLNQFWSSFGGGLHLNASISFNTSVIAAAIELDLARDPDELDYNFSPLEAEERRRVFWALFSVDTLTRALLGKTYAPFDATIITVRLPCHLPDEAFSPEGNFEYGSTAQPHSNIMTSVITIHSLSLVLSRISKALTGPRKSSRNEIVKLHDEIKDIEMNYRSSLQQTAALECSSVRGLAQVMIWFAYVKLHRSSLRNGTSRDDNDDIAWHRSMCIQHCDNLLDSYQMVYSFGPAAEFLASTMICSAAITVAIDLRHSLSDPTITETSNRLFSLIKSIECNAWSGGIYRRGAIILRHLDVLMFVKNPEEHKYAPIQDNWSIDIQMIQTENPPFSFPAQPFIHKNFSQNSYDDPSLAVSPLPTPIDSFTSYSRAFEFLPNDFQNEQGSKLDLYDGDSKFKSNDTLMDPWIVNSNPSQVEWQNFGQQSSPLLALLN